jgi:galactose mutarotase-like enzyme
MITIENEFVSAQIKPLGAELVSFFDKNAQQEFMWGANPEFWGKTSPVLFPIVGALKNNQYTFEGKIYTLPRHGFARERAFFVESNSETEVIFLLVSDEKSKEIYPFDFEFRIKYQLTEKLLSVTYSVKNTGGKVMYFSVGGHPAFKIPFEPATQYDDYFLEFNEIENSQRWDLTNDGLIKNQSSPFFQNSNQIKLTKELFYGDALVFDDLKSHQVSIKSEKTDKKLTFDFTGFPYLGIWAAENADFVCIEPWCGIADYENHNQELKEKTGINKLNPDENFEKTWSIEI